MRWYDYLLLVAVVGIVVYMAAETPLNFDEAYNMQVPLTLARHGRYDTIFHSQPWPFDAIITISTGPTVLVPAAFTMRLLGAGVLRARLICTVYFVAFVILVYRLCLGFLKRFGAVWVVLALLSVTRLARWGVSVMGEIPALVFILLGLAIWEKSPRLRPLALLIWGLSILTKRSFALFGIAICYAVDRDRPGLQEGLLPRSKRIALALVLLLTPSMTWEGVKLLALGPQMYAAYAKTLGAFVMSQMRGGSDIVSFVLSETGPRVNLLLQDIFPGTPPCINGFLVLGALLVTAYIAVIGRGSKNLEMRRPVAFLTIAFLVGFSWWILLSGGSWRHVFPYAILLVMLVRAFLGAVLKLVDRKKQVVIQAVMFLFILPSLLMVPGELQRGSRALASQRQFASGVRSFMDSNYLIGVSGWWQAPEIAFLGGGLAFTPFVSELEACNESRKYLVIYTGLEEALAPDAALALKSSLGDPVLTSPDGMFSLHSLKACPVH